MGERLTDIAAVTLVLWTTLSWLTHVIYCIQTEAWGFLIAGAIFFPIGMIHGTGLWLGFF